jgi:hypothetical protein
MRTYKVYVLALLGFMILVASLVMSTPFAGHSQPKGKRSPEQPSLAAAPVVLPEHLSRVAVDSTIRETALTTVQETGPILFKEGELEAYLTFPVPVGKGMIIETVSARAQMTPGQRAQVMFSATAGGGTASFALPMIYQGRFDKQGDTFAAVQALRAYADGGSVVTFRIDRSAVGELDFGFVSISGFLESR